MTTNAEIAKRLRLNAEYPHGELMIEAAEALERSGPSANEEELIEACRVAILGMLEPKRTPIEKPSIATLEALLASEDTTPVDIKPDGTIDRIEPRTTNAREIAETCVREILRLSAERAEPVAHETQTLILDLAMTIRRLCRKIEIYQQEPILNAAAKVARDFLKRKGLEGSLLRDFSPTAPDAAMRADAERYRWLRSRVPYSMQDGLHFHFDAPMHGGGSLEKTLELHRSALDAAIDAARADSAGGE